MTLSLLLVHPFYTKTRLTRYLCNQISQNCTKKYQTWLYEIIRFLKIVKFLVLETKKDPFHTKNEADQVSLQSDFSKLYQKWLYEIIPFPKIVKFLASSLCFILSLLFTKVKDNKKGPFLVGKRSITFRWNVSQLSQVQKNDATFSS